MAWGNCQGFTCFHLPASSSFLPSTAGPSPTALRLMLFGELVSGAGFQQDRLYIEWRLLFDPELWLLQSPGMSPEDQPGVIKVSWGMGAINVS